MKQFARAALALLAAAGIFFGGQIFLGKQAVAAPLGGWAAGVPSSTGAGLVEKVGYGYWEHHGYGGYNCHKRRYYDGSFDLYCRHRHPPVNRFVCSKHYVGGGWRMHCDPLWRPYRRCHHYFHHHHRGCGYGYGYGNGYGYGYRNGYDNGYGYDSWRGYRY